MSLTILDADDGCLTDIVRSGTVVLVPSFAEVLQTQKMLADSGLALGVEVATPRSWARDRWDVWGDGRRAVDGPARVLLMSEVLVTARQRGLRIEQTPGTARLLCALAERGLPWMREALALRAGKLTPAELDAANLLAKYDELLMEKGLVEPATCMCELPHVLNQSGVVIPPVVLSGFSDLSRAERALVAGLAQHAEVTLVERVSGVPLCDQAKLMVDQVANDAEERGVEVSREACASKRGAERAADLDALLHVLFCDADAALPQTDAVGLLEPSGPLAEAELVAQEVRRCAERGLKRAVVVVPDARRAWRELAPKLVARGLAVSTQLSVPVLKTEYGRAFMGFARTVAHLAELAKTWPAMREGADGAYEQLGDMSWWPPHELVDFLLCDIAHVEIAKAQALDVSWRTNRLLSPQEVLEQLQSVRYTSSAVEQATRELLKGRLGSAASKLLASYVRAGAVDPGSGGGKTVSLAAEEAVAALQAILGVAGTLKELGVTADPSASSSVSLTDLVSKAELALGAVQVALRPKVDVADACGEVLIASRGDAATMAPASVDVAVLCGLTSTEFAVPSTDTELDGMLQDLGIEPCPDALAAQRAHFLRLCALPTKKLLLERTLFSADSSDTYPAVMLTELLSCSVRVGDSAKMSEDDARKNLSAAGVSPERTASETVSTAGHVLESLRRLVIVPQEGKAELAEGLPVLSASQIESYLECPLKWFSLRRLRLGDNDAGFGPLEMGTFAHRVLELTYAQLFAEGRASLDPRDAEGMAYAHAVLDAQFHAHVEHQHMRVGSRPAFQALVAHSAQEQSAMERLHRELSSVLEYEAQRLEGYTPRAFEWGFGRGKAIGGASPQRQDDAGGMLPQVPTATYAGVSVTGTVDRIDVNGQGQAVIIDYKHKGPAGFFGEYAAFGKDVKKDGDEFVLPRRIQALMYAQVVRRAFSHLRIVGALYLGTRGSHELSGAVDELQADAIFGGTLRSERAKKVIVPRAESFGREGVGGMDAYLDAVEEAIAAKVDRMREGYIEANPLDAAACSFCPVANCERRIAR